MPPSHFMRIASSRVVHVLLHARVHDHQVDGARDGRDRGEDGGRREAGGDDAFRARALGRASAAATASSRGARGRRARRTGVARDDETRARVPQVAARAVGAWACAVAQASVSVSVRCRFCESFAVRTRARRTRSRGSASFGRSVTRGANRRSRPRSSAERGADRREAWPRRRPRRRPRRGWRSSPVRCRRARRCWTCRRARGRRRRPRRWSTERTRAPPGRDFRRDGRVVHGPPRGSPRGARRARRRVPPSDQRLDARGPDARRAASASPASTSPPPGVADSFVVLPRGVSRVDTVSGSNLNARVAALARIFDMASDETEADHPMCLECAAHLREELDARARETEAECEIHRKRLAELARSRGRSFRGARRGPRQTRRRWRRRSARWRRRR